MWVSWLLFMIMSILCNIFLLNLLIIALLKSQVKPLEEFRMGFLPVIWDVYFYYTSLYNSVVRHYFQGLSCRRSYDFPVFVRVCSDCCRQIFCKCA